MVIKGLCVKGLDTVEISQRMVRYVANYFYDYKLGAGQSMFVENFILHFDEVRDTIPAEHHILFTDDDKFSGMSGYVTVDYAQSESKEHVVMLLMDEHSTYIYFLCLQETNEKGEDKIIIINDFLSV